MQKVELVEREREREEVEVERQWSKQAKSLMRQKPLNRLESLGGGRFLSNFTKISFS